MNLVLISWFHKVTWVFPQSFELLFPYCHTPPLCASQCAIRIAVQAPVTSKQPFLVPSPFFGFHHSKQPCFPSLAIMPHSSVFSFSILSLRLRAQSSLTLLQFLPISPYICLVWGSLELTPKSIFLSLACFLAPPSLPTIICWHFPYKLLKRKKKKPQADTCDLPVFLTHYFLLVLKYKMILLPTFLITTLFRKSSVASTAYWWSACFCILYTPFVAQISFLSSSALSKLDSILFLDTCQALFLPTLIPTTLNPFSPLHRRTFHTTIPST